MTGLADKKCSLRRATFEDFQQIMSTILASVDGPQYKDATEIHIRALESLGRNVEFAQQIFDTYKELRGELLTNDRSCEEDIEELKEKAQAYLDAVDKYFNSQKALENFKTDPKKINDPILAEFLAAYKEFNKTIWMLVEDPEFMKVFFQSRNCEQLCSVHND